MRHGRAVPETSSLVNFRRYLTERGKEETRLMAKHFAKYVDKEAIGVYISPLVRTQETAWIMAQELRASRAKDNVTSATLYALCRDAWPPVAAHLQEVGAMGLGQALIISHQPFLESWLRLLTGTDISFQQSGIAAIDWNPEGKSKLVAYLTPTYWEERS